MSIISEILRDLIGIYYKTTLDPIRHKNLYWDTVRMQLNLPKYLAYIYIYTIK